MKLKVLVACEESQEVCKAFRAKGHEAYSCDIQDCSGGHPEWHIKGDVLPLLNGNCEFVTCGGGRTMIDKWDLIIAHPPCTDLAVSGARSFPQKQKDFRQQKSCVFFMRFVLADCENIAIENPVGIMSSVYRKPDQIIQPWQFALTDDENTVKTTCLWLKGLPKLKPLHNNKPEIEYVEWVDKKTGRRKRQSKWYYETRCYGAGKRGKIASKTFPGIARAMAEQWG
jgi:site-specific DNA-cytosine methylase